MKEQDLVKDNVYAILYKRILTYDEYYIFFPCQCVEGYYDKSDKSFMDIYNNLYYSCDNYTMINTGQSDTYYYDTTLEDIKKMTKVEDKEEAISRFYDHLKSNILIGHINNSEERIEIYEINREKLNYLKNNIKFKIKNGNGSIVLLRKQLEELLEENDESIKDKINLLLNKLDYLEKFSREKQNIDLSVTVAYNNLMTKQNIEALKLQEKKETVEQPNLPKEEIDNEKKIIQDSTTDVYDYITSRMVGQDSSVKKVLGAVINNLYAETHEQIIRPFIIGGTGSGKSFLFKLIEKGLEVPVIIVDCNQLVQSGYEGKMIDDVLKDLYLLCDRDIDETERAIVVFDEIDKIGDKGATVSEIGVQQTLLKFIEGQKYVVNMDKSEMEKVIIDTSMMSIAACGAFEGLKQKDKEIGFSRNNKQESINIDKLVQKAGMIPELLGRFNLYVEYNEVTKDMIREQLQESITSPTRIKKEFYENNYGIELQFTDDFIETLCDEAIKKKTGFRGVDQVVNQALSEVNFIIQTDINKYQKVIINKETLEDPKKYILK